MPQDAEKEKWCFRPGMLVLIFFCVGPFVLPLVWMKPRLNIQAKVFWTLILLAVTYFLGAALLGFLRNIKGYLDSIQSALG